MHIHTLNIAIKKTYWVQYLTTEEHKKQIVPRPKSSTLPICIQYKQCIQTWGPNKLESRVQNYEENQKQSAPNIYYAYPTNPNLPQFTIHSARQRCKVKYKKNCYIYNDLPTRWNFRQYIQTPWCGVYFASCFDNFTRQSDADASVSHFTESRVWKVNSVAKKNCKTYLDSNE